MKVSKIFKTTALVLALSATLTGCIKETFPTETAITKDQLLKGDESAVLEALLPGIHSTMLSMCYSSGLHSDYGMFAMGMFHDYEAQQIACMGEGGFNHFNAAMWGYGYGPTGMMSYFAWSRYYPQIRTCNEIIQIAAGKDEYSRYTGIAKAFRASFYLDLARLYDPLYAVAPELPQYEGGLIDAQGLTVPIIDESFICDEGEQMAKNNPRVTREEIFNFIFADLADAEACLAEYARENATEPNLAVVYGLYARAYMWLGGETISEDGLSGELPSGNEAYALAAEYANKAIAAHGGSLMTEAEWTSVTSGFNTVVSSWMLSLVCSTDTIISNLHQHPAHLSPELRAGYFPYTLPGIPSKWYDKMLDGDFRKKLIKGPDTKYSDFAPYTSMSASEFNALPAYVNFKYRPALGNRDDNMTAGAVSLPLMRLEEMYFIDIEATYHISGGDAAFEKLRTFMLTRNPQYPVVLSGDILDEILFQKGIEFWGEGLMMFDFKRLDKGVDCTYKDSNFDERSRFKSEGRLPWWNYCIPLSETDLNKGITYNNPDPSYGLEPVKALQ